MATFKDDKDREWVVSIDVPTIKALREHDLDVLKLFDGEMEVFQRIIGDPINLVDTLWIVCKDQSDGDETSFAKALLGDALMRAAHALVEAVCDFFPDPKRRQALKETFRKINETEAILLENAVSLAGSIDPSEMALAMQNELGVKSGGSPGSLESTPA